MNLEDISVGQKLLIKGTVKSVQYQGGAHFDTIKLELDRHDTPGARKTIFLDPDNIGNEFVILTERTDIMIRYQVAFDNETGMSLEGLEAATVSVAENGVITITPAP